MTWIMLSYFNVSLWLHIFFGKNTQIVVVFGSLWLQEVAYYVQSDEFELVGF